MRVTAPVPVGDHLMRKASFLALPAFISSRIHLGVAPRPAQVSLGFFLLRYFGATLRPLSFEPLRPGGRPRLTPLPTSVPVRADSCLRNADAFSPMVSVMLSRRSIKASIDILVRLFGLAMWALHWRCLCKGGILHSTYTCAMAYGNSSRRRSNSGRVLIPHFEARN